MTAPAEPGSECMSRAFGEGELVNARPTKYVLDQGE